MKKSRTFKCFKTTGYGGDPDYRLIIKSEISENFKFSVKADDFQNHISFFTHIDSKGKYFDGMTKRELLKHYQKTLREEEVQFSKRSHKALRHCRDFESFCDDVISFEVLKLVEEGKPITLAHMRRDIAFTNN
jgi:LPS sulfotransferase NodH